MAKPDITQTYGKCENRTRHESHVFLNREYDTHYSWWDCPGVYVDCLNCDDRQCMACVFREMHNECRASCPECGDGLTRGEREAND